MAVTIVDNRVIVDDADTVTGWTPADGNNPTRAEGTGSVAAAYNIATGTIYFTPGTPLDLDGDLLYVQSYTNALQNGWKEATLSDSSHMLYMNDGTNELALAQAGSDRDVFKHLKGQVQFQSFLIDLDYLATKNTNGEVLAIAGSVASFVKTSVNDVGGRYVTLSKALGGGDNCFCDIIRVDEVDSDGNTTTSTSGLSIYGGGVGTEGTFAEIVLEDESVAADKGHGVIREYTAGAYGAQGIFKFGTTNTLGNAYFQDSDFVLTFENRDVNNDKFAVYVFGNATNTNSFQLTNGTISSAGPGVTFDMSSDNIDTLELIGISVLNTLNAISFPTDTITNSQTHEVTNCTFLNTGTITPGTVPFDDNTITNSNATTNALSITNNISALRTTISGYEGTAGTGALFWNVNEDPDGNLNNSSFTKGTAATHAIHFGSSSPATMTLRGIDFSGYNAADGNNDSTLYFADTGSDRTWTVNAVGCTGNISFRKERAGDTVNIVADPVTILVTATDADLGTPVQNARVLVWVTSTVSGFPYQASISITGSGTTATVTHTAHGLSSNDNVRIEDAVEDVYNGAYQITVTGVNTYTYTTNETIAVSPATGSPTSTFAFINGLTDINGEISDSRVVGANQPVNYRVRKYNASPYYRQAAGSRTVDSTLGLSVGASLISDE